MANINKNPYDSIDLSLLIESFDESIGTLYPVAIVYAPNGSLLSGSPFSLSLVGNNLYALRNAFQADVNSGTYMVIYEVYTDAGHTVKSASHGQRHDTITISIQSTTGLGGGNSGGGDIFLDDEKTRKLIREYFNKLNEKVDKLQKDFDDGLKVEIPKVEIPEFKIPEFKIPEFNPKEIVKEMSDVMEIFHRSNKGKQENILDAIRKNRNTIIKSKFDRSLMTPILSEIINSNIKILKEIKETKIDLTKTIDIKNEKLDEINKQNIDLAMKNLYLVIDNFNESLRKKLKYTIEMIKMMVHISKPNSISINVKKDEL